MDMLGRTIERAEGRFLQAYGILPWLSPKPDFERSSDNGLSILSFLKLIADLTRRGRFNDAIQHLTLVRGFPTSNIWCLPIEFRETIEVDPSSLKPDDLIRSIFKSGEKEADAHANGVSRYAIWPEFSIKIRHGHFLKLSGTSEGEWADLKLAYILMVAEELAHSVQSQKGGFEALSNFMKAQGKRQILPIMQWKLTDYEENYINSRAWPEEDVYAFLIETFGPELVPRYFAAHYPTFRKNVFEHFYSPKKSSVASCETILGGEQ